MLIATRSGKINISKEKDTKLVAERLCKFINLGDFILLTGNLGVGKTTFIKYIINSLQRKNRRNKTYGVSKDPHSSTLDVAAVIRNA